MVRRPWSSVARCLLAAVLLLQASLFPGSGLAVRPVSAAAAASLTEPEAPTASPDPTLNSTFDSPLPPPVATPQIAPLTLALQVTPNWVEPGDVLTVTVTAAASAANDLTALVIQDTLPAGLLYVAGSARGFESTASENALTWQVPKLTAGTIITGSFQARVQGLALGATVTHTVTATTAQPPASASSAAVVEVVSPGNNDLAVAPERAGWLRSTDDRVLLRVPAQLTAATRFSYRARPDVPNPPEGLAYAFTLDAAAADGSVAQRLTAPVQLKVHYPRAVRGTPQLFRYNETDGTWQPLSAAVAASTAEIQAAVDYGGTFAVAATSSTPDTITPQLSQVRGAQAALYSRAINYQYDLTLPPGRGGLAPFLALRYQSPDHRRLTGHYSVVGHGWQLTGADAIYTDGQERFATLVLGGQSYNLVFIEGSNGVWVAKEDPFLKITHTVNVNCCDWDANSWAWSEWWVTTRDGMRYRYYGQVGKDAANQWSAPYPMATQWGCSPRYTSYRDHLGVIVPLVAVQDPQGNQITYTWATSGWAQYNEVQNHACVPDQNVVAGLYIREIHLQSISYNGGRTRIQLAYAGDRLSRPANWQSADTYHHWTADRLATITVQAQPTAGDWREVRHYELGHSQPGSTVPGPDVLLNLDSITEWGGSAGLATSFTYANPGPAYTNYGYLTRVQNAFGGQVTFEAAELYPQTQYQDHWTRKIITARTETDLVTNEEAVWRYNSSGWLDDAGGFARVWVTQPDNRQTLHVYNQGPCYANASTPRIVSCPLAGREQRTYLCNGYDGTNCQQEWTRQETDWQADAVGLPFGTGLDAWNKPYFVRVSAERQYELSFAMRRTDYTYDPARQGNVQYGNLTGSREYAGAGTGWASAPLRASATWYYPNPTQWIVDRPATARTYSGAEATLLAERRYRYDNQAHMTPPTQGRLTHLETLGVLNGSLTGETHTESYGYDGYGNLASVQDASGHTTTTEYDRWFGTFPVCARKVLDPTTNHTTKLFYHGVPGGVAGGCNAADGTLAFSAARFGLPERMVDPNNVATQYTYDDLGRPTAVIRQGESAAAQQYSYRGVGEVGLGRPFWVHSQQRDDSAGDGYYHTYTFYDGFGRVLQTKTEADGGQHVETTTDYTWFDAAEHTSVPVFVTGDLAAGAPAYRAPDWAALPDTQYAYDPQGRVSQATLPDGTSSENVYEIAYNPVDPDFSVPRMATTHIDPNRHFVRRAYDAFGNLRVVTEATGSWPVGGPPQVGVDNRTHYTYDALGRLTAAQDAAGNQTTIGYDAFGRKSTLSDPDMGAWSYGYDAAGNLTRQTDARGKTLCYAYDGLNRLTTVQEDTDVVHDCQGTLTGRATHSYDAYDGSSQFGVGRRTSLTNSAGSVSWVYDRYGRVTQETRSVYGSGGGTFVTGYSYNAADRVTSVTYPDGEVVSTTYTAALLPNSLSSSLAPYVSSSVYDAAGRLDLRVFRPNDLQTDYVYYAWHVLSGGRLNQLRSGIGSGGAGLQNLTYAYDLAGNVTRIRDDHNSGQRQCFVYDALNRLKQAHIGDANCVALSAPVGNGFYQAQTYDYSADGNLGSQTALGSYTYNAAVSGCSPGTPATKPHAVRQAGSYTYSYDCNGNQTGRTVGGVSAVLTYDAENRLTGVSGSVTAGYAYDGDGQRVKATLGSGDAAVVTAYAGRLWEQTTRYQETYDDGLAQGWTATSGTWTVTGGRYQQSSLSSNTNSYRALAQNGPLYYRWVATYASGTSAGLYLMASAGTGAERGNSYRIWQDATHVRLYENVNNAATERASFPAANASGQAHSYGVLYDPTAGRLTVLRDGVPLGNWRDPTPLASGAYLALRTDSASVQFDDVAVSAYVKYYELGGTRVALRNADGLSYLFGDHLGSTSVAATASAVLTGTLLYGPWGATRYSSGVTPTAYRYTGQREEAAVGLYFYGARWYDPLVGRFIQPDTLVPDPANPQSLNRYAYALNSPLRYTDPSGHVWRDMSDGAGVGGTGSWVGALASAARTNQEYSTVRALLVTVASVAAEPIDWGVTLHQCVTEGCNPALAALGLLPLVPGSVTSKLDEAADAVRSLDRGVGAAEQAGEVTFKAVRVPTNYKGLRKAMEKAGLTAPSGMANPQAHHDLPWDLREWFAGEGRGLNVNDIQFGRWVEGTPPGRHQNWSREYNDLWQAFMQRNPNATRQQVLDYLQELRASGRYP